MRGYNSNYKGIVFSALLFFIYVFVTLNIKSVSGVDFRSPNYVIQYGNINIAADNLTSGSYNLSTTLGQLAAGKFQSDNFVVRAGFQYWHSIIPFRFTVTNTNIDLGTLEVNTFKEANTVLRVSFGGAGEYQVTAIEETPLITLSDQSIPNTKCDNEADPCTPTSAKTWSLNNSAYGFGYHMDGMDIPGDFDTVNKYRPFPDKSADEPPAIVMTSGNVGIGRSATMTFRANINNIQPAGSYHTIVNYVATPTF